MPKSFSPLLSLDLIARRRITIVLLCAVGGLVTMNFLAYAFKDQLSIDTAAMVLGKFLLNNEQNVPSWFSSMLLLAAGGCLLSSA